MNLPWTKSLRTKFALAIVVAIVVPMLTALFLAKREVIRLLEENYHNQLKATVKGVALELREKHEILTLLARDIAGELAKNKDVAGENWPEVNRELQRLYQLFARETGLSFIGIRSDGASLARVGGSGSQETLIEGSGKFIAPDGKSYEVIVGFGDSNLLVKEASELTGAETTVFIGAKVVATNDTLNKFAKGYQERDPEVLEEVLRKGRNVHKIIDRQGEENHIIYAPIKDARGNIFGMVAVHQSNDSVETGEWIIDKVMLSVALLLSFIGGVAGFGLAVNLTAPLRRLAQYSEEIARGNLTVVSLEQTGGEIGDLNRAFGQMVEKLGQLIGRLRQSVDQMSKATGLLNGNADQTAQVADQIAATVEQFAAGAEEQVNKVNEIHGYILEVDQGVQQVTKGAKAVRKASIDAYKFAEAGNETLTNAAEQMKAMKETMVRSSGTVKDLGEKSQAIGKIIDVITNIAKQTNLLALNAAIEAARAGEQGRGFAVVADEVRKLAEQSAEAATQVTAIIGEIRHEAARAIEAMGAGNQSVEMGMQVIAETGESLRLIVKAVRDVYQEIQDLNPTIQQMAVKSEEVTGSMDAIAAIAKDTQNNTQQIMASLEEQIASIDHIVNSIKDLSEMAEELKEFTGYFKVRG